MGHFNPPPVPLQMQCGHLHVNLQHFDTAMMGFCAIQINRHPLAMLPIHFKNQIKLPLRRWPLSNAQHCQTAQWTSYASTASHNESRWHIYHWNTRCIGCDWRGFCGIIIMIIELESKKVSVIWWLGLQCTLKNQIKLPSRVDHFPMLSTVKQLKWLAMQAPPVTKNPVGSYHQIIKMHLAKTDFLLPKFDFGYLTSMALTFDLM